MLGTQMRSVGAKLAVIFASTKYQLYFSVLLAENVIDCLFFVRLDTTSFREHGLIVSNKSSPGHH